MAIISIAAVIVFSVVLCLVEIPKMLQAQSYKELWVFAVLLGLGVSLAILKSLGVTLPNPSDWVAWVYSPLAKFFKLL